MSDPHSKAPSEPVRPPRPPFDHDIWRALESQGDAVVTDMRPEDVPHLRAKAIAPDEAACTRDGEFTLSRHSTVAPDGTRIRIVLLRPHGREAALPVVFHIHGGGMVVGSAYDSLPQLTELAHEVGAAVASVEYRLAPEHPYPAAVEDSYAGLAWLSTNAASLGLDPARIIVHGVSAGGGLAAAVALLARDRGTPHLLGQMLICPMLDHRNNSASGRQMAGVGAWDRTANETGWSLYLGDIPHDEVPIYASPARADDLSNLPPAFIDVGSAETFRDEDLGYASKIWACGGDAELHVWPGGVHGFDDLAPDAPLARDARRARERWLTRLLDRTRR
ncbi:alpha/beta hydrolase [Microbacterium sp. ARD32]|uniref:alpha/beta hydrolase n=1 Tax=Microbacterium sp. ARD32 TaxID=2962577 RepID=UPI0028812770|nr:alpha/beta hydrolase [Microbacterium sp. ARD32]MDT0157946.1 alpha/beta hydrolase [Microbacterium sp. ARD32]